MQDKVYWLKLSADITLIFIEADTPCAMAIHVAA
ncbi:hypothetical protein VSP9026_02941 [Vibrio spartinae]|uniref:Uncharacterized protein n=1 Tax=Vibrio spartinae TaxID=1918945 RepID=A0A1N6M762_9VIBR|nr:hypothetical protein VSP9026_02941 [Vibrio spartinae]